MPKIVRCTIEMELVEGRDFPEDETDSVSITLAKVVFFDTILDLSADPEELALYIQAKIVEDVS